MSQKFTKLLNEYRLTMLLGRLTISQENEEEIGQLLKGRIDWYKVFVSAARNKVLLLLWKNISERGLEDIIQKNVRELMKFYYIGTKKKNEIYCNEFINLNNAMEANGIKCAPLKGVYLIPNVYKDFGCRYTSDMDILISKSQVPEVCRTMEELGYSQGDYHWKEKRIVNISRARQILWKSQMSNLYPFIKVNDSAYCPLIFVDFRFSINQRTDPVDEMLFESIKSEESGINNIKNSHFLAHLCHHLYFEANNVISIKEHKEINLIKFSDIREFVLNKMNKNSFEELIRFSLKYNLNEALYYTFFYLKEIYNDGYESQVLGSLNIEDDRFLFSYGEKDYKREILWKKTFWQRLFSMGNEDEIDEMPEWMGIE